LVRDEKAQGVKTQPCLSACALRFARGARGGWAVLVDGAFGTGGKLRRRSIVRGLQVARSGRAEPLEDPGAYPAADEAVGLGAWDAPAPITGLISAILRGEGLLSRAGSAARVEIPGLSWWALCRKP